MRIVGHLAALCIAVSAASAAQASSLIHEDLSKLVKISETEARKIALARVPGQVQSEELEREHHRIVYSYDIKLDGRTGVEEVQVDAISGKIVSIKHESEAAEKKEKRGD